MLGIVKAKAGLSLPFVYNELLNLNIKMKKYLYIPVIKMDIFNYIL